MNIAVLGAPHTGKTRLVSELNAALNQRGHRVFLIAAEDAKAHPGRFDLTLVCGLDWPLPVGEDFMEQACARQAMDTDLRAALTHHAVSFQVVYGANSHRLSNALRAVDGCEPAQSSRVKAASRAGKFSPGKESENADSFERWQSVCDKCSDPACEHRMFTQLID